MGPAVLQDTFASPAWTSITFLEPFDTVPHVHVLPTNEGGDPATVRVRNVTTTGFEALQVEPNGNDGPHVAMNTAYLAIEPGSHVLPDGTRLVSLDYTTTSFANRFISTTWDNVAFPIAFPATPAVLASIQTVANESGNPPATSSIPFMDVGIRNVSTTGLQSTLERAESTAGTVTVGERIAILAIENGTNISFVDMFSNQVLLQAITTPRNIRGWDNGCFANNYIVPFPATPLAVASTNTRSGNNGGWLRRCGQSSVALSLTVDEDIDNDAERNHTPEAAGIVAGSIAFHAKFEVDLGITKSVEVLSDPVNAGPDARAIPQATMQYTIQVENTGSISPDASTVVVFDTVPEEVDLCVTAACLTGGPVIFDDSASPVPTGVTLGTVEYSDDDGLTYIYVPSPDAFGFDPLVDAVRITMNGTLASIGVAGAPQFDLRLAARVD